MKTPEERYLTDPVFHRVVDTIAAWIDEYHITPSEAREAAMLAATIVEARRPLRVCCAEHRRTP